MSFSNLTVRHSSTKIFRRDGNLRAQIFHEHHSEPEAAHLSSVEDVTATAKVQTRNSFFPTLELSKLSITMQHDPQSKTADGEP
jgi:hypothetical protein